MLPYEIYCSTSLKDVESGKDLKEWEKVPWKLIESDVKVKVHESESERGCDFTDGHSVALRIQWGAEV